MRALVSRALVPLVRRGRFALVAAALLALAGCASYGYPGSGYGGGYGDQYGGYGQPQYGNEVVGTVRGVDRGYNRIVLAMDGGGYGGREVALYYDNRTTLYYQGRQYPVEGLEPGDVIRAVATDSGGRLYARQVEVVRNVRESGGYYPGGGDYGYGDMQTLRGRVAWVDERSQVIQLESGTYGGQRVAVRYDNRTTVEWRGERYPARDLDAGDVVRIDARRSGANYYAERIWMESNAGR